MPSREDASYIDHLEAQIAKLEAQIKQLQQEMKDLKAEKGISSAHEGLSFNQKTGTWADKTGVHFCPKCLDKQKRNPLKTEDYGWRCSVCEYYYSDPDRPEPPIRYEPSSFV